MTAAQLINQTSGKVEYYTPQPIIEAARRTMGGIDLDPASSVEANKRVGAERYFGQRVGRSIGGGFVVDDFVDGLQQYWYGRVFMNHPFGRQSNKLWVDKLLWEFTSDRVTQACCITFACTSEKWFRPLLERPQCFLVPRTNYLLPDGSVIKSVTKGSVVTYFGPNVEAFAREFSGLGVVKVPYEK